LKLVEAPPSTNFNQFQPISRTFWHGDGFRVLLRFSCEWCHK
jgi:hypothetical protein